MTPSNIVGSTLIMLGLAPFILWILDYVDMIRPGKDPAHWGLVVFAVVVIGLGVMLRTGQGAKVSDAFLSWFNRGHTHE